MDDVQKEDKRNTGDEGQRIWKQKVRVRTRGDFQCGVVIGKLKNLFREHCKSLKKNNLVTSQNSGIIYRQYLRKCIENGSEAVH